MTKRILRPVEVQARLGVRKSQFWDWIKSGKLPKPVRLGRAMSKTWQRLADFELSVPSFGRVTVSNLLEQISASDSNPTMRDSSRARPSTWRNCWRRCQRPNARKLSNE